MTSVVEKKLLMDGGKSAPAAGDAPGEDGDDESDVESRPSVPFNFAQMTPEVYKDIPHRTGAKAIIDLTASDGLVCLSQGVSDFGICHNSSHIAALTHHLQSKVFGLLAAELVLASRTMGT
jgi:hypothetical protein